MAVSADNQITWDIFDALPDPALALDGNREIIFANKAALGLLGEDIEGGDIAMALRQPLALSIANAALDGQNPEPGEIEISRGTPQIFEVRAAPILGNRIVKALITFKDNTRIKQADDIRSTFVANVSHELRSPLASLIGFIETLQGAAKDDPEARKKFLSVMENEASRMSRLIDDLLSLSSVEVDEHVQPREAVSLIPLLRDVVTVIQARAANKEIKIISDFPQGLPDIPGDVDQLTQVFQNLLENAMKYGRSKSEIRIKIGINDHSSENSASEVIVSIADRGDGIPAKDLSRLTERFYRVDKARSRELGGTGLGLAIVKHIVGRHRGRLEIGSEEGLGSTFTVILPTFKA
jgi:two-component system phosphate regulon sensor histidine kinase PhoR